jgi:hypothetical protein
MPSSSAVIQTHTCKAVLAFPWTNGVVLADNRRAFVEEALANKKCPEEMVDMIQVSNRFPRPTTHSTLFHTSGLQVKWMPSPH